MVVVLIAAAADPEATNHWLAGKDVCLDPGRKLQHRQHTTEAPCEPCCVQPTNCIEAAMSDSWPSPSVTAGHMTGAMVRQPSLHAAALTLTALG